MLFTPRPSLSLLAMAITSIHSSYASADHPLEEVLVSGQRSQVTSLSSESLPVLAADSGQWLKAAPGADVNRNGPLSGIAQYRGMFGPRVSTHIDGMPVHSGGPNWMDPPLHYAPALLVDKLEVNRGIPAISQGAENIGGQINAQLKRTQFSDSATFGVSGEISGVSQTANNGYGVAGLVGISNQQHNGWLRGITEAGDDMSYPGGDINPTEYQRQRYDAGYALKLGNHQLSIMAGRNETGEAGTPALPMDIVYFDTNLLQLGYQWQYQGWLLNATIAQDDVEHTMTNYHLRQAPASAMAYRSTLAESESQKAKLKLQYQQGHHLLRVGYDWSEGENDAVISNPNMAGFRVVNFNQAERDVNSSWLEWIYSADSHWQTTSGVRLSQVTTNADEVSHHAAGSMAAIAGLMNTFNQADRKQQDTLFDALFEVRYALNNHTSLITGIARKTRAPSYQERYLWLPMEATAGMADANTYVGDINLKPEVNKQLELGLEWQSSHWLVAPRIFYQRVDDFIQGIPSTDNRVIMISTNMGNDTTPLQFANVNAKLYGFDALLQWRPNTQWTIDSTAQWLKGEREDTGDNLYRLSPAQISINAKHQLGRWHYGVRGTAVADQEKVARYNEEQATGGYGLLDVYAGVQLPGDVAVNLAVENALDREYREHLSGYSRVNGSDVDKGERIPGSGVNAQLRVSWQF